MSEERSVEERAREMGWSSQEEFRGDPEKFISAEDFVRRGEELMPILKANNQRQAREISELKGQVTSLRTTINANQEAIQALVELNSKENLKKVKEQRTELTAALAEAREDKDTEKEVQILDQLDENRQAITDAEKKPEKKDNPSGNGKDYTEEPSFKAWKSDNPWYGQDRRKTTIATALAQEMRADPANANLMGREFLDKVTEEVEKVLGTSGNRQRVPKVEEGGRGSGGGGEGGNGSKSYSSLPQDAKEACERQASRVVGEGRAFKTVEAWRKHYAAKYYEE